MIIEILNVTSIGQLLTCGNIQLPGIAFANVCTFGYLACKQTSQRIGKATEYAAKR